MGIKARDEEKQRALDEIRDIPEVGIRHEDTDWIDFDAVIDGQASINVSHAGGKFQELLKEELRPCKKRREYRARRDAVIRRTLGFSTQLDAMVRAYLRWSEACGVSGKALAAPLSDDAVVQETQTIRVVDLFDTYSLDVPMLQGGQTIAASLIERGLLPSAPYRPNIAFAIRVIELFRTIHLRCPHLAIQPFVKSLCDLHRVPFKPYLSKQFSITYDVYLSIREETEKRVQAALDRNTPKWRLRNACPACTYKLAGEKSLVFDMLVTMDGNDSLKRVIRREPATEDENGELTPGTSKELRDDRDVSGDYYLDREAVDRWTKGVLQEMLPTGKGSEEGEEGEVGSESNPCAERWKNMVNELTARMWGIFDETGIFLALCRHGFVLLIADMVQSGELAKYPLAVVNELLDVFGTRIGGGYDIGCKFGTTIANSPLGPRAGQLEYKSLVGSFHGHAHNRRCQLSFLAKYVEGLGLEDLKGCERFFSKSNALASSVRYASIFHRKQSIQEYAKHMDKQETYATLSTFLVNNYKQALRLINGLPVLEKQMKDQGVMSFETFMQWLAEEKVYLEGLSREPLEETLQMEYYQKLVNLEASQKALDDAQAKWLVITPENHNARDYTRSIEMKRRHVLETHKKDLKVVQDLETKLGVATRWTRMNPEWRMAAEMAGKRRYQRCLDDLEALVVSRMFELTKMNMSQMGYKLRKHIGKALKARSQAVRNALDKYNAAARALSPPRPELSWDLVVEYAFLADFDILSDTRQDVRERPWAAPAARIMMDEYFKIQRAREEIDRLNVEIQRLVTYMRDEEAYLQDQEKAIATKDSAVAHQIFLQRDRLRRFNVLHSCRLRKLASHPGFTGCLDPGVHIQTREDDMEVDEGNEHQVEVAEGSSNGGTSGSKGDEDDTDGDEDNTDGDEDNTDEDEEALLAEQVHKVIQISSDV
ncbi:hypothetical protein C0992_002109 [Termitomyces sp. T32_za158]|nr:hypothetical protein C0992_002109 [Termitomyces sp. T32_za158]